MKPLNGSHWSWLNRGSTLSRTATNRSWLPLSLPLSEHVQWNESNYDPARLQLVESRQHSSTDLARLLNVPGPVIHAPSNDSMTYTNAQEQRADLWWFGLAPHAAAIADTLSGPNVTPRGTVIRFQPAGTGLDPFTDTDTEDETA